MAKRIVYPAGVVRTPEQIVAQAREDASLYVSQHSIWAPCWNCNGTGNYPSSMDPPGRCRLYCWAKASTDPQAFPGTMVTKSANDPTYGKLPYPIATWVKRQQTQDRSDYRHELARPERERIAAEQQAKQAAEQAERERAANERRAAVLAEKAKRVHVGTVGARITLDVTLEAVVRIEGGGFMGGDRHLVRFRDAEQNQLIWWTDGLPGVYVRRDNGRDEWIKAEEGATHRITATIKKHDSYQDEAQTIVQRVKFPLLAARAAELEKVEKLETAV